VLEARQALERAEQAHADDPGSFDETSLSYVASRRAKLATTYAAIEKSRREQALADQQVKAKLATLGTDVMGMTPQQFSKFVNSEIAVAAQLFKAAGIKPQ